jgi:carnitine-CoA ligase
MIRSVDPVVEPSTNAASYPQVSTLGELLGHWVSHTPQAPAISFVGGDQWTWADLGAHIALAQCHLRDAHIEAGDRVGLVADNSPEMVAALVALVTMGAVAVPVNTALTTSGVQQVIQHSQPRLVYAAADHIARCSSSDTGVEVRPIGTLMGRSAQPDPALVVRGSAEDLAMIIYSSGTTGAGKGVMLSHGVCLTASAACAAVEFEASTDDRIFTCLPLFHCAAQQMGLWTCLVSGACLILDRGFQPDRFWATLREEEATAFHFIGPMLSRLWDLGADSSVATGIRLASGGGPRKEWERFEERYGFPLVECYGMTEVFGGCVSHRPGRARPWTLGRAMEHVEVRVADPQPWEDGTSRGEIQVRPVRPNVMFSGYFRDPERTERAWDNGWYKTGDVGSWTEDALLVYHSRVDDVIRRRGENVSAVELESVLSQVPGIRECAVTGIDSDSGDSEILVAIVSDDVEGHFDLERFWDEAEKLIPRFALPRYVLVTTELPKTATDRVQRHRLRERVGEASIRTRPGTRDQ